MRFSFSGLVFIHPQVRSFERPNGAGGVDEDVDEGISLFVVPSESRNGALAPLEVFGLDDYPLAYVANIAFYHWGFSLSIESKQDRCQSKLV